LLDEAVSLGVEQFSFTGGEPFVVRDFVRILDYASRLRPCFVLTNGTDVLRQRGHQIAPLRNNPHPIRFRVSLDYPHIARHDAGRGEGSFVQSMAGIRWLLAAGFEVSIARQSDADEDAVAVDAAFRALFAEHGVTAPLRFTVFPDLGTPGSDDGSPEVTVTCMEKYPTPESRAHFMCSYSRMLIKQQGQVRVYACTLVDDDPDYDLGDTLQQSLRPKVMLRHPRCFSCYRYGASCSAP
jgi:MoaA/NifB/PqqE/SkfB family radical SAM enzyme